MAKTRASSAFELDPADAKVTEIVPRYLLEHDHPWLRALLDEHERYVGKRRAELEHRLAEPLVVQSPAAKRKLVLSVIERLAKSSIQSAISPAKAREATFDARAAIPNGSPRDEVLARVARELGISTGELEDALFADLPGERRVRSLGSLSPAALAQEANTELVCGWLARAASLRVRVRGNTRALVRHARITGLICSIAQAADGSVELDISGPLSLFRKTTVYGRALASLVPRLAWCERFELRAACLLESGPATLVVRSGDPIRPARELSRYDSRLEERFAKDFGKLAPDWDILREPRPVQAGGALVFPDFELRRRGRSDTMLDPGNRRLLDSRLSGKEARCAARCGNRSPHHLHR